ncbi:DUF6527 family protein [Nitrosopumilus adriaticus]|uniref:Uncharacterized protein n=1 Tax=Nitrosopumilus adriaticus TaxID=1580092 RepID=A0A0D5C5U0_9ARCH|nr:DUF6527 family protein [Nitrosopumilus adriaticus]AJW71752.1 hypothetical protein NADRNF5_2079 [Nitrosopumilus adriaticus]
MKRKMIRHKFVDLIPDMVEEGVIYISIPFSTATHKCVCGCGEIIVTPIKPTDWEIIWNGDTVSLNPSIGNWSLPCQSHYWIEENKIIWSRKWNDLEIEIGREKDTVAKAKHYGKFRRWLSWMK